MGRKEKGAFSEREREREREMDGEEEKEQLKGSYSELADASSVCGGHEPRLVPL